MREPFRRSRSRIRYKGLPDRRLKVLRSPLLNFHLIDSFGYGIVFVQRQFKKSGKFCKAQWIILFLERNKREEDEEAEMKIIRDLEISLLLE